MKRFLFTALFSLLLLFTAGAKPLTVHLKGLDKEDKITFPSSALYENNGAIYYDLPSPILMETVETHTDIKKGDAFLDTSSRIIIIKNVSAGYFIKGKFLGNIKEKALNALTAPGAEIKLVH